MYLNYLEDKKELGFRTLKDIEAGQQVERLVSTLGISVIWMFKKSNQIRILIFSKEFVVAIIILGLVDFRSNIDCSSSSSSEIYQCFIRKSDNSEFKQSLKSLKSPSPRLDSILKLKGGSDELTDEEQEELIKSLITKVPQSSYQETSINKLFKRVLKGIEPVISDQRFWRILSELQKPIKSQLPVGSTDILNPAQTEKENQPPMRQPS